MLTGVLERAVYVISQTDLCAHSVVCTLWVCTLARLWQHQLYCRKKLTKQVIKSTLSCMLLMLTEKRLEDYRSAVSNK